MTCTRCFCDDCTKYENMKKSFLKFGYILEKSDFADYRYRAYSTDNEGAVIYDNDIRTMVLRIRLDRGW